MLERGLHQGTGLLQNRPWARTRVAAVATAPDAASLDTLWLLCALLQSEGTSVVVLDASVPEHEANPGLEQLLTSTSLCTLPSAPTRLDDGAPGSLAVLPAARGLQQLSTQAQPGTLCSLYQTCDTTGTPLARLLPMLRAYDLVLLHAPMSCLGPLLQPHGIRPLLLAQPGAEGTQEAYRQLKHLALYTGLSAQLCVVVAQPGDGAERAARTQLATLQRCAHDYLGIVPPGVVVCAWRPHDLQRLALQVQENASTMEEPPILSLPDVGTTPASVYVRNH